MACVLVVEDQGEVRDVLVDAISEEGFTIVTAATGEEAVEQLEAFELEMVVTDINLPGYRDGIEVAVAARRIYPGIPILFISGRHWRLADAEKLGGPAAFLRKPFSLTALIRDMNRLMAIAGSGKVETLSSQCMSTEALPVSR